MAKYTTLAALTGMTGLLALGASGAWAQAVQTTTGSDQTIELNEQPRNQEQFDILAKRVHRARVEHYGGSPARSDAWRMYPGELPEKGAFTTTVDLDGRVVSDPDHEISGAISGHADVDSPATGRQP